MYEIVAATKTPPVISVETVDDLAELASNWNDPSTGGKGFYLSYGVNNYTTNQLNNDKAFVETTSIASASIALRNCSK